MPISLQQIAQSTATVQISVEGDTLTVEYYPNKITDELIARITAKDATNSTDAANDFLVTLLKSWDLYQDNTLSSTVPITTEEMAVLPVFFKAQIVEGVLGHIRPELAARQTT